MYMRDDANVVPVGMETYLRLKSIHTNSTAAYLGRFCSWWQCP